MGKKTKPMLKIINSLKNTHTQPCQSCSLSIKLYWMLKSFVNTVKAQWFYVICDTASKNKYYSFSGQQRAHYIWEKLLIVFRPSNLQAVEINYCQCSVAGLKSKCALRREIESVCYIAWNLGIWHWITVWKQAVRTHLNPECSSFLVQVGRE